MDKTGWRDFSFLGNYINGRFVIPENPSNSFIKKNPADISELIAEVPVHYPHCEEAVNKASESFKKWSEMEGSERLSFLHKLKNSIEMLSSWLVELLARELGRPIWDSKQEVTLAIQNINAIFEQFKSYSPFQMGELWEGEQDERIIEVQKPRGVVVIIAPFNQPVLYPLRSIFSALLLGNTVVYKPSEYSPMVGQVISEAVHDASLPKGIFNMVHGEKEVAKRLIKHRQISSVFFNGTFESGLKVSGYVSGDYWKLLVMGTGGKNSAVIMPGVNINDVVSETLLGAFISSGQKSNSIRRIFVHSDIADEFTDVFHKKAKQLKIGHPLDEYTDKKPFMGPLISERAMQNYLRLQGIGLREGAELLMRGKEIEVDGAYKGYYVTPSINLTDNLNESGLYNTSEIFGPNVSIKRFSDLDMLITSHNSCGYGYGLSVFSASKEDLSRLVMECDVGQVFVNTVTFGESVKYPIVGYGKSGNALPVGSYSNFYLNKPVVLYSRKSVRSNLDLFPYEELKSIK